MSTGFSPPDSSGSLSLTTSSQTDRQVPESRAMATVVERSSKQASRESSQSSTETGARNRSRRKSQQRAIASSPYSRDASEEKAFPSACAGFPPGMSQDEEMVEQRTHPIVEQHQHEHLTQHYVDQRAIHQHQHVHIEDELARREAHEARVAALQVQAEAQRAVIGAEQAAQNIAIQANLEVNRVVEAAHSEVNRVVGSAASENEQLRQQNIQQQQMIEALQVRLQQQEAMMIQQHGQLQQLLQSRNSADFVHDVPSPNHAAPIQQSPTSSSCRPPRIPTPKAPSEASNMSAELQAHMTDAVKALGQQIGESMKSMQDQINQFASSRMPQAASLGMEGMVMTMMVTLMILMRMSHGPTGWLSKGKGSKTGALEDHQGTTHQGGMATQMMVLCPVVRSLGMRIMYIGERICPTCRCRVFQRMLQPLGCHSFEER